MKGLRFQTWSIPCSHFTPVYCDVHLHTGPDHSPMQVPLFLQLKLWHTSFELVRGHLSLIPDWAWGSSFNLSCPLITKLRTQPTKSCDITWPVLFSIVLMSLTPPIVSGCVPISSLLQNREKHSVLIKLTDFRNKNLGLQ